MGWSRSLREKKNNLGPDSRRKKELCMEFFTYNCTATNFLLNAYTVKTLLVIIRIGHRLSLRSIFASVCFVNYWSLLSVAIEVDTENTPMPLFS